MRRSWTITAVALALMVAIALLAAPVHASDVDSDSEGEVVMDLQTHRAGGKVNGRVNVVAARPPPAPAAARPAPPAPAAAPAKGGILARMANAAKAIGARVQTAAAKVVQRGAQAVQRGAKAVQRGAQKVQQGLQKQLNARKQQAKAPAAGAKKPLTAGKAAKQAKAQARQAKKTAGKLKHAKKAVQKAQAKAAGKGKQGAKGKGKKGGKGKGKGKKGGKGKKAARKARRAAAKKAKQGRILKAKKAGAKPLRLTGDRLRNALRRVGRAAFLKGRSLGWQLPKIRRFVRAQIRKFRSRHQPKPAHKVKDPKLKQAIKKVATKQSREAISKLQAALKKKSAGSVELPIKHHKITVHPRTPAPKKLKIHRPSPTDKNYVKHLEQSKKAWKKKIAALENAIVQLTPHGRKNDWPIEYSPIDPPDAGKAAMAEELYTNLKPFLKDAVSIKQADLEEGRQGLVDMEALRWVVHDKLVKARATPLLPEMYRFIE